MKTIHIGILTVISTALLVGTAPAYAQEEVRQFSAQSGAVVNEVLELADAQQTQAALNLLQKAVSRPDLTAYERSTIYQMMGQYSYELDRPVEAQQAFENAINAGGLLPKEVDNIKSVLAQLMIGNGQFRDGAERLESYLEAGGERKPQYIEMLVQAWVQAEDYPRALPWAEKWFEMASPKQRKHYDLMNFLYRQLGQTGEQLEIIKHMVERWPEDTSLWDSLVSVLASSGQEKEAFEVTRLMYQSGLLKTEGEILTLAKYHNFYEMPFQAAEILEAEIGEGRVSKTADNLKYLASLFRRARLPERALPILETAAELSPDLDGYVQLGQTFSSVGDCVKAANYFQAAVQQGYVKNKAQVEIGSCYAWQASKLPRLSCNIPDSDVADAPITLARKHAIEVFEGIPKTSEYYEDAQKWVSFISADVRADERRCGHNWHDHKRELCYQKIKLAYDAMIFTDRFALDDKSCTKYKPDYDAEFRTAAPSE